MSFTSEGMPIVVPYKTLDVYQRLEERIAWANKNGNTIEAMDEIARLKYEVAEILIGILGKGMQKMHLIPFPLPYTPIEGKTRGPRK